MFTKEQVRDIADKACRYDNSRYQPWSDSNSPHYGDAEHFVQRVLDYAATLRQQAARVDEGWTVEQANAVCVELGHATGYYPDPWRMRAALTAALAQNTQGEEPALRVPEKAWTVEFRDITGALCRGDSALDARPIRGCALYTHAERARVPDALRHAAKVIELYDDALGGSCEMATSTDCAEVLVALADYYAAAPSQPKDAGEVES